MQSARLFAMTKKAFLQEVFSKCIPKFGTARTLAVIAAVEFSLSVVFHLATHAALFVESCYSMSFHSADFPTLSAGQASLSIARFPAEGAALRDSGYSVYAAKVFSFLAARDAGHQHDWRQTGARQCGMGIGFIVCFPIFGRRHRRICHVQFRAARYLKQCQN